MLLTQIIPWVAQELGIQLQEHQHARVRLLLKQYQEAHHLDDQQFLGLLDKKEESVFHFLVQTVTVQESYFFRDKSLFHYLIHHYLPLLIQQKIKNNDYTIRVWSAGCARGEEIYSLAILLNELLPDKNKWRCYLLATDINKKALEEAKRARYSSASMRIVDNNYTHYFTEQNNHFSLKNAHFPIYFEYHNLASNHYPFEKFDMIFCRNVFIYLKKDAIETILKKFEACLSPEGRLFLGPSDFLTYLKNPLTQHIEHGVTYYTQANVQPIKPAQKTVTPVPTNYLDKQRTAAEAWQKIKNFLRNKSYDQALMHIDNFITVYPENALIYQYKAEALSELGDIETAREFCIKAIKLDNLNWGAYLLKGKIDLTLLETAAAKTALEKALFIKPDCTEATYYLNYLREHGHEK